MKKLSLIIFLFLGVLLLERCKKTEVTETVTSTNTLFATINDTSWSADTITAALNYSSATATKVFTCTGIADNKELNIQVTQTQATNTPGIPLISFTSNASTINFSYATSEKNSAGVVTWYPQGAVTAESGFVTFTVIDSVKKVVSGTFNFVTTQIVYNPDGTIYTTTHNQVQAGAFNNLPYKFTSN
jgi:hypothetical protein